jgi:hypothetical protein
VFGFFPWESLRIFVESYGLTSIFSDGKGRFLVRTNPTAIRHGIETAGFSPTCVVSLSNSCWVWGQAPPCCSVDTRSNDTGETLRAQNPSERNYHTERCTVCSLTHCHCTQHHPLVLVYSGITTTRTHYVVKILKKGNRHFLR